MAQIPRTPENEALGVNIIGATPRMQRIFRFASKIAATESAVLITGESGTGKELLAKSIHFQSARAHGPFLAVNCGAIPENLVESELFGHVRGSFTGATTDKKGLFEQADGGTIFLDEVGELSPQSQVKLLRALQDGEVRSVGSNISIRVDVRPISATNRDLRQGIEDKTFREDLYYRLNVFHIELPPLRDRQEDIALLASYFLEQYANKMRKTLAGFSEETQVLLLRYRYPGNVRELENAIQRAVAVAEDQVIRPEDLPPEMRETAQPQLQGPSGGLEMPAGMTLEEVQDSYIRFTLDQLGGNASRAARQLGVSRSTLWRKLKQ
ncbi:MAG: sigma-54-dependent Fis family transcriptional regulator [Candidatus Eisenbacteria bacterium]|uniref:Sigma-54-dependent Fis family transcriptional regulator n=1 Tax=Eiseniibacteriota bacterium TaxID=2212470 RepID=A0A7Y2E7P2_UNCEI|nr:sigma-54-dependent Fis family transcriptional regulator [Candidatus Eisenbacteria bacterium]